MRLWPQVTQSESSRCLQVFMLDAETGREVGYGGTVAADKLRGVPPADPFACADLQGRYMARPLQPLVPL